MGGVVSTGRDNDGLVNNLIHAQYIKTTMVEDVFRFVDRGLYFPKEERAGAYKDFAWRRGNLHLSAPCIYSEVLEGLYLSPGLSFLNLGSGTGYLNTMVGLILGPHGINHGIEIHEDVIMYAYEKLKEFQEKSSAIDLFDFCVPKFFKGNCLWLSSDFPQYDRVYCGAACPKNYVNYMKNLVKVGGILIMPVADKLVQYIRDGESCWSECNLLSVSFDVLLPPDQNEPVTFLDIEPLSLQEICRFSIRSILKQRCLEIDPTLKELKIYIPPYNLKKRKISHYQLVGVDYFEECDNSTDDDDDLPADASLEVDMAECVRVLNQMQNNNSENSGIDADVDTENQSLNESSSELKNASDIEVDNKSLNEIDMASSSSKSNVNKCEKFDSGLSKDSLSDKDTSLDSDVPDRMNVCSESEEVYSTCSQCKKKHNLILPFYKANAKPKYPPLPTGIYKYLKNDSDSDGYEEYNCNTRSRLSSKCVFSLFLCTKIYSLPLPMKLKDYLKMDRHIFE